MSYQEAFGFQVPTTPSQPLELTEQGKWNRCYYRCLHTNRSFSQARGIFYRDYGYWPPRSLKNMPVEAWDWLRKVSEVPKESLIQ